MRVAYSKYLVELVVHFLMTQLLSQLSSLNLHLLEFLLSFFT